MSDKHVLMGIALVNGLLFGGCAGEGLDVGQVTAREVSGLGITIDEEKDFGFIAEVPASFTIIKQEISEPDHRFVMLFLDADGLTYFAGVNTGLPHHSTHQLLIDLIVAEDGSVHAGDRSYCDSYGITMHSAAASAWMLDRREFTFAVSTDGEHPDLAIDRLTMLAESFRIIRPATGDEDKVEDAE